MADPRITPARPDLAASYLRGTVEAARYADGDPFEIVADIAPVHEYPRDDSQMTTQALRGERVTIYDSNGEGWAWGQLDGDGYVGWLPDRLLCKSRAAPTHRVTAIRTLAFVSGSIKLPPLMALPMGARLTIARKDEMFAVTDDGLFVPLRHVAALDARETDFVTVAERFVGTPYLWGGKTSLGIDCSGLVQIALGACGIVCPRDSDMQLATLGRPLASTEPMKRGDLVFWKGHVAIARDAETLLHANAYRMATALEPAAEAIARIAASGSAVLAVRRLDDSTRPAARD